MWAERSRKLFLRGFRKQLWRSCLLDMMLWQFWPQGLAKARTKDNSWLPKSEGNRNGIFVEERRQTFLYCYKWGREKHFVLRKIRKTTANKLISAQNRTLTRNLEIKTDQNPPITNYKPWPFVVFEMNIYCGWHSKNHGSLAGGIFMSCSLRSSWQLCCQISLKLLTLGVGDSLLLTLTQ